MLCKPPRGGGQRTNKAQLLSTSVRVTPPLPPPLPTTLPSVPSLQSQRVGAGAGGVPQSLMFTQDSPTVS
jgi:hypothetical protein